MFVLVKISSGLFYAQMSNHFTKQLCRWKHLCHLASCLIGRRSDRRLQQSVFFLLSSSSRGNIYIANADLGDELKRKNRDCSQSRDIDGAHIKIKAPKESEVDYFSQQHDECMICRI